MNSLILDIVFIFILINTCHSIFTDSYFNGQSIWCHRTSDNCINHTSMNCSNEKYRTFDGSCNNLLHPTLGMALTTYKRLLPANYGDKVSSMPMSTSGTPLPSARLLAFRAFGRHPTPDPKYTLLNMQWGQLVTHDLTMRLPADFAGLKRMKATKQQCCSKSGRYETRTSRSRCYPIPVPKYDPVFKNYHCINFERSVTVKSQECPCWESSAPAEQLNGVTHYMDLSQVYGSSRILSHRLRSFKRGLLTTTGPNSEWPPHSIMPMQVCTLGSLTDRCYDFGDERGNQNPGLASLQIILLREHNRIAQELGRINPHWDDETLFQEARRINIAQFQHITYYEWSPNFFGTENLINNEIIHRTRSGESVEDYDPLIDPRGIQSFHQAAFRYFHSQIVGHLMLFSESRNYTNESYLLTKLQDKPGLLETRYKHSSFVRGLTTQPAYLTDKHFDFEATENFIFTGSTTQDLRTVDIQRSRDHGLPSYNDFRGHCTLKKAKRWSDYLDLIPNEDIDTLKSIYESYKDVDLAVGGALERHEPDALVGPTFLCIILKQFKDLRQGDRYFYESSNQPYPFTKEQLIEIRKANAARLMCDNSDVEYMQPLAFRRISKSNALQSCSKLPKLDLSKWKDPASDSKEGILDSLFKIFTGNFGKE